MPVALVIAAGGLALVVRAFVGPAPEDAGTANAQAVVAQTVRFPAGPGYLWGLVTGHGSVWVQTGEGRAEDPGNCGGDVLRFDATTGEKVASIRAEAITRWETGGGGTAVSADAVWILGTACPEGFGDTVVLQQIDPVTNAVVDVLELGPGHAVDVAADDSGVWLLLTRPADQGQSVELAQLDPTTGRVARRIPLEVTGSPSRVFIGDGAMWVVAYLDGDPGSALMKIDPETGDVVATLDPPVDGPGIGAFGMWAASGPWEAHGCTLVRIDPIAVRIVEERPQAGCPVPASQLDIGEGGVWYLRGDEDAPRARLVRYNPVAEDVDVTIDLGEGVSPVDVTLTEGAVWVLGYEGSLTRVQLR